MTFFPIVSLESAGFGRHGGGVGVSMCLRILCRLVIVHRTSAGLQLGDHKVYTIELPNFDINNVMNTQYSEKTLSYYHLLLWKNTLLFFLYLSFNFN